MKTFFTINKTKSIVAFSILILVNLLFVYKYIERETSNAIIITAIMALFYITIWIFRNTFILNFLYFRFITITLLTFFIGFTLFVYYKIPLSSLNVDRWSVITSFWESFFNSEWVYNARSYAGNPPGPMPFYFILSLPFMLVGGLGIITLLGLLLFMAFISRVNTSFNSKLWSFIFLMCSFFNLWEIVTRSNIFFNSTLILGITIWFLTMNKLHSITFLLNALVAGLLLSTRSVFIIPYIILFLYTIRVKEINLSRLLVYGIVVGFAFMLSFVPFIVNHGQDFLQINPFIIQSTFLVPFYYTAGFILLAFVSSFLCKNKHDVYFYSGLTLFISIAIYFVYHVVNSGFREAYIESVVDISYFIFCTPFLIYYLVVEDKNGLEELKT